MSWRQQWIVTEIRRLDPPREIWHEGRVIGRSLDELVDVATGLPPVPGDLYSAPWYLADWPDHLAPYYYQHNAHRPPIMLVLPAPEGHTYHFCVDMKACDAGKLREDGWTVTGNVPDLTVAPSINAVGTYHGFLQNGVLTDDCDGRQFPNFPPRP